MRTLLQDLRYGIRVLRRSPGFTAVAVLSLALGIGANTAIFSVIAALMLKMLPVKNPAELIAIKKVAPAGEDDQFSYLAFTQLRDSASTFGGILAATTTQKINVIVDGEPELVYRKSVSGNYFPVLGVTALLGRTFTPEEDRLPAGQPVAVISHGYWQRRFGRDVFVLGRAFTLDGTRFSIIGVLPPEFFGESVGEGPDIWTPLTVQPLAPSWLWNGHSVTWLRLLGRRNAGVTLVQARTGLEPVFARIQGDIAGEVKNPVWRQKALETRIEISDGSKGFSRLRERFSRPLRILMAIVGLVLLIACGNIANLLLARAAARQKEIAVRLAIGAGRLRLVRQLVTESLLLGLLGGGLGLLFAQWGESIVVAFMARGTAPLPLAVGPDPRVLAFTGALSLLTGMLFGLAPALRATAAGPGRRRLTVGKSLVIAQSAISLLLLIGAGLFVRTLQNLKSVDMGFNPESVLVFRIDPSKTGYKGQQLTNLYQRVLERVPAVPAVRSASLSFFGLFTGALWGNLLKVEGYTPRPDENVHSFANAVSPKYFEVMGMPLLSGRGFETSDNETASKVAVVNQTFARHYFGSEDPIGRRFGFGPAPKAMIEIVGVVKDAKYRSLQEERRRMIYVPYLQYPSQLNELEVRAAGDPVALAAAIRRELAAVDRSLPVLDVATLRNQVDASIAQERLVARLASFFGLLALLLACVGLYGLMSYSVARRTSEIGIRIALGAQPGNVLWLILRESLVLVVIGVAVGLPGSLATTRLVSSLLFGLKPTDPGTIAMATFVMLAVAGLAGYLPARKASRVDPMVALRYE